MGIGARGEPEAVPSSGPPAVWAGGGGCQKHTTIQGLQERGVARWAPKKESQQSAADPPPSLLIARDLHPRPPRARPATTLRLSLAAPTVAGVQIIRSSPQEASQLANQLSLCPSPHNHHIPVPSFPNALLSMTACVGQVLSSASPLSAQALRSRKRVINVAHGCGVMAPRVASW
jgi:hypothetical protein